MYLRVPEQLQIETKGLSDDYYVPVQMRHSFGAAAAAAAVVISFIQISVFDS